MHKLVLLWLLIFICCLIQAQEEPSESVEVVIEDFQDLSAWGIHSQLGKIGESYFAKSTEAVSEGFRASCKLHYDLRQKDWYIGIIYHGGPILGKPERFRLLTYGNKSGHPIVLRFWDAKGQTFQRKIGELNFEGWKWLEVPVEEGKGWLHYGGGVPEGTDGTIHYPVTMQELLIDASGKYDEGDVYFQSLTVITRIKESESLLLDISTEKKVYEIREPMVFTLKVSNLWSQKRAVIIEYKIADYLGKTIKSSSVEMLMEAHQDSSKQIRYKSTQAGLLYCYFRMTGEKFKLEKALQVGVIPRRRASKLEPGSPFGMGIYFGNRYSYPEMEMAAQMAEDIGIKWSREEFSWAYIEPEKGKWQWERYDKAVEIAYKHNICLFGLLDYWSSWTKAYSQEGIADFCNYVKETVSRYKDKIKHWEIWNEPNIGFWTGPKELYIDLLKEAYKACKEADPNCQVIGICTAGTDLGFIEKVFKADAFDSMDILSIHPYRYPGSPEETNFVDELKRCRALVEKYGKSKPIWLTEIGWPTHIGAGGVSEAVQANMIVRMYIEAIASRCADKIFWYDYRNDGLDKNYNEHNFGIIHRDFAPKPAYIAYGTMTAELSGAKYIKEFDLGDNIRAYLFEKTNRTERTQIVAAWAVKGEAMATFRVKENRISLTDLMGNVRIMKAKQGIIQINLTESPIFLKGKKIDGESIISVYPTKLTLAQGDWEKVRVTIKNVTDRPLKGIRSVLLPSGEKLSVVSFYLLPGRTYRGTFRVGAPSTSKQPISYKVKVSFEGSILKPVEIPISINIIPAMEISMRLHHLEFSKMSAQLQYTLTNNRKVPAKQTKIQIDCPKGWQVQPEYRLINQIKPGDSHQGTFILRKPSFDSWLPQEIVLTVTTFREQKEYTTMPIVRYIPKTIESRKLISFALCHRAKNPLVIDADLSDWEDAHPLILDNKGLSFSGNPKVSATMEGRFRELIPNSHKGPRDLSATLLTMWDEDNFYIAAKIIDDKFHQPYENESVWQGDNVQVAFDPLNDGAKGNYGKDDAEIGLTLTPKGPQIWRWISPEGKKDGEVTGAKLAVKRKDTETIYEAAIPLGELGLAPSSIVTDSIGKGARGQRGRRSEELVGKTIGFAFIINDNDGGGRKGWLEWFSGIGYTKDPSQFGDLTFGD